MPVYAFEEVDGPKAGQRRIELAFPMASVPRIGEVIEHEGRRLRRLPSDLQIDDGAHRMYPYVSRALPRGMKGAKHTKDGMPIIRSRRHESEVAAQQGLVRD